MEYCLHMTAACPHIRKLLFVHVCLPQCGPCYVFSIRISYFVAFTCRDILYHSTRTETNRADIITIRECLLQIFLISVVFNPGVMQ